MTWLKRGKKLSYKRWKNPPIWVALCLQRTLTKPLLPVFWKGQRRVLLMTKSVVIARLPICFFRSSEEVPRGQEPVLFVAADCCDGLKHTVDTWQACRSPPNNRRPGRWGKKEANISDACIKKQVANIIIWVKQNQWNRLEAWGWHKLITSIFYCPINCTVDQSSPWREGGSYADAQASKSGNKLFSSLTRGLSKSK